MEREPKVPEVFHEGGTPFGTSAEMADDKLRCLSDGKKLKPTGDVGFG
jgi:hypothetical protein